MDHITKNAFIIDVYENTVTKLAKMKESRYTFECIKRKNFVYVMGGRTYGTEDIAIKN
jgi:hypothetical protein